MTRECAAPPGLSRTVLAATIALVLTGPAYAAGPASTASQYDSSVAYADYRDQQGSYKLRASDLIGREIRNAADDEIGEIDDLIVSRDGDKVMAIVSVGGFLGAGSRLVAIPYQDLRVTKDGKHVYYGATKDELQGRSEFTYADGEHSESMGMDDKLSSVDGGKPGVAAAGDVNRYTGDSIHAAVDRKAVSETKPADNSTRNARDRADDQLTPLDQSHAAADVEITRSIRKALVGDDGLGTNAQNVKVITVDGTVTLRGPVSNADERARIVAIAKEAAGPNRVQDDLEVIRR